MKREYIKPKLVRVKLNPEQAVLSQCSDGWSDMKDSNTSGKCASGGCRQKSAGGASTASS